MQLVGLTHQGRERSRNEDSYLARTAGGISLCAVADGMGGHVAGDVASALAVSVLERFWTGLDGSSPLARHQLSGIMQKLMLDANRLIFDKSAGNPEMQGMGTTLTVGLLSERDLVIGHVGDSRAYLIDGERIVLLTEDHSLIEQMIQQGSLSPAEARDHPQRHILTRALGIHHDVEVDVVETVAEEGSTLLLCTDGLTSLVGDEEILAKILEKQAEPEKAAQALVELANARGGYDNITVVLAAGIGRRAV